MQNAARRCLRQAARAAGAAERWRWRRGAACSATVQQLSGLCLTRAPAAQQIPLQQQQRRHRGVAAAAAAQQSQQQQQQSSLARSVRAVPITVLTVAKGNSRGAELMASEWADKLRRYTKLTEVQVKPNPKNAKEVAVAVAHEGERVLKAVAPGERLVLLDERGRDISSEELAQLLAQASDQGWPSVVFCIGGPFGHAPAVRERGDDVIRLSKCVLNHQVAHVVLLEQLYRAWTILRGEPYHH